MEKGKIKNLTVTELKKQGKQLEKKGEIKVEVDGKEFKLTHDLVFRKTKQQKIMEDLIEFFTLGSEEIEILELATPYTALLIIKYFTDLEVPNDIHEAIVLLELLIDLDLLNKIVDKLPEEQLVEVFEMIAKTVDEVNKSLEEATKEAENEIANVVDEVENNRLKASDENKDEDTEKEQKDEDKGLITDGDTE